MTIRIMSPNWKRLSLPHRLPDLVGKRADTLSKDILSVDNKMGRAEISDEFLHLSGEAVREFNTDSSLYSALESRGWNKFQRGFVFNIIQEERTGYAGSIVVELMLHGSTANNMVVGVQDWITLCGKTLCLCDGDDTLRIDAVNGSIDIILTKDKRSIASGLRDEGSFHGRDESN